VPRRRREGNCCFATGRVAVKAADRDNPLIRSGRHDVDFIERIFGLSPDGGSGSLEFLLFALPIAGLCWLATRRRSKRRDKD